MSLSEAGRGFVASVSGAVVRLPNVPGAIGEALARFWAPRGLSGTLHLFAVLGVALGAGWLAERGLDRLAQAQWRRLQAAEWEGEGLGRQVGLLLRRLGLETLEAAALLLAAWAVIEALAPPEPMSALILSFFLWGPVLWVRATALVTRFFFASNRAGLRLVNVTDAEARFLSRSLVIFAGLAALRDYALDFLGGHGVTLADARLGFWLSLLLYAWLMWVIWHARAALTRMLMGRADDLTAPVAWIARIWPRVAMGLVALFWGLTEVFTGLERWELFFDGRLPLTLAVLVFAPALDTAIRGLVHHVVPPMTGEGAAAESADAATRRGLVRIGRVLALFLVVELLADLWNFHLVAVEGGGAAAELGVRLVRAAFIAGAGYLLCEIVALWANRRLSAERAAAPQGPEADAGGEGGGTGGSRLSTVLPLLSKSAQAAIAGATVLFALAALGVNTTPLLAGAGIVGLALGFGAQKLVTDIVSGIFFLIDDAFRTGEYVEIGGTFGTVEKISVRSLQLRHHEGPVHTIPFGEIPRLTNYSRDWVIMKLRFTVPFDTDLKKVKKLFKQIGREMMEVPEYADAFLQPFKSQGVHEVDTSAS